MFIYGSAPVFLVGSNAHLRGKQIPDYCHKLEILKAKPIKQGLAMKTLHLTMPIIFWVVLGFLGLGQQITMAAEGEVEYRFERMVPQLEQARGLNRPEGVAVASDGSIWVADLSVNGIQFLMRHLNPDGTFIAQFEIAGLSFAVSTDGSLWVSDYTNHRIQHLNADGSLISQFGREGQDLGQFESPRGIALAADGSIWVADSGNNRLQHLKADGTFIAQIGRDGQTRTVFRRRGKHLARTGWQRVGV